jgi:hypothetical protein
MTYAARDASVKTPDTRMWNVNSACRERVALFR